MANKGVRAGVEQWGRDGDFILMNNSFELTPMGERCTLAGFSLVWAYGSAHALCFTTGNTCFLILTACYLYGHFNWKSDEVFVNFWVLEQYVFRKCGIHP